MTTTRYRCRLCGATSYRRVIARDSAGDLVATALYHCSGCSVTFTDPAAWRATVLVREDATRAAPTPFAAPSPPDFSTWGISPKDVLHNSARSVLLHMQENCVDVNHEAS